jgi:hypothetical protein
MRAWIITLPLATLDVFTNSPLLVRSISAHIRLPWSAAAPSGAGRAERGVDDQPRPSYLPGGQSGTDAVR